MNESIFTRLDKVETKLDKISTMLGINLNGRATAPAKGNGGRVWSKKQDQTLLQLVMENYTYESIAEKLGRTEKACSVRYSILRRKVK